MEIVKDFKEGINVLTVTGKLDSNNASEFDAKLREYIDEDAGKAVILEFSGVQTLTSAPLRAILSLAKRMQRHGSALLLAAPSENALESLKISGFLKLRIFELTDTLEAALVSGRNAVPTAPRPARSASPPLNMPPPQVVAVPSLPVAVDEAPPMAIPPLPGLTAVPPVVAPIPDEIRVPLPVKEPASDPPLPAAGTIPLVIPVPEVEVILPQSKLPLPTLPSGIAAPDPLSPAAVLPSKPAPAPVAKSPQKKLFDPFQAPAKPAEPPAASPALPLRPPSAAAALPALPPPAAKPESHPVPIPPPAAKSDAKPAPAPPPPVAAPPLQIAIPSQSLPAISPSPIPAANPPVREKGLMGWFNYWAGEVQNALDYWSSLIRRK